MATDTRVRIGKRIVRDSRGIYKSVTIFGEPEPEEEVRQIRTFHPGPIPEPEPVVPAAPVQAATPPEPPTAPAEPPAKPKRVWKPRPYKPRPKKTK